MFLLLKTKKASETKSYRSLNKNSDIFEIYPLTKIPLMISCAMRGFSFNLRVL